jgi:hypothetical protein
MLLAKYNQNDQATDDEMGRGLSMHGAEEACIRGSDEKNRRK